MTIAAEGNDAVVEMYERLLAKAREGRVCYAFSVAACDDGKNLFADSGTLEGERRAGRIAQKMAEEFAARELNVTLPPRDPSLDASTVCYDVPNAPLSFDFIPWMVDQEMTRAAERAPAPLKVGFWFGRDGKSGLDPAWRRGMLDRVCRPALELIGAVETYNTGGRSKGFYSTRDISAAARAGVQVPRLLSPSRVRRKLRFDQPPVVITLREAKHWPHRNSNLSAWMKFADLLRSRGERVVFVRDTARADESLSPYETDPLASRNLLRRMALYEAAKLNFFTSNGPCLLGLFSDVSFMMLNEVVPEDHPYRPQTASFQREFMGIDVLAGDQYPWMRPNQHIFWKPDSFENIMSSYESFKVREAA